MFLSAFKTGEILIWGVKFFWVQKRIVFSYKKHSRSFNFHYINFLRLHFVEYCISSYSFRGNYSFLSFEIQRSHYISPKVTVHKGAETIQGRKLFKGGNYMRKYGIWQKMNIAPRKFEKNNKNNVQNIC